LTGKTVSIIAGGYLGSRLAKRLNDLKYKVNVSFRTSEPKDPINGVEYTHLAINDGTIAGKQSLFDCDTLVICLPPGFKSGLADSYPTNISNLVELAQDKGVKHIIFTSSTGIYTKSAKNDEFSDFDISQVKPKVLSSAESSVLKSSVKFKHVVRLAGLMGNDRAPGRFKVKIDQTNASQLVNMVMIDDVITAIITLIAQPVTPESVYNLVAPNHPSRQEFYRFAQSLNGTELGPMITATRRNSKWVCGDLIELQTAFRYRYRDLFAAIRACAT
jgi:nucleoside-diphosphate-sugar epimerase